MPYAAKDRQEFIKRSCPGAGVLDIGGMISERIPSSIAGITMPRSIKNAVLLDLEELPFKDSAFDTIVSYHYFDMIPSGKLDNIFREILRVMDTGATLSFMITLWGPQTEPQRTNLFFNELLESTGVLFHHEFEDISKQLSESGFKEITVERIDRDIILPGEYVKSHVATVGKLLKKKDTRNVEIRGLTKQYVAHVKMHGEAMLPAVHFSARKR